MFIDSAVISNLTILWNLISCLLLKELYILSSIPKVREKLPVVIRMAMAGALQHVDSEQIRGPLAERDVKMVKSILFSISIKKKGISQNVFYLR